MGPRIYPSQQDTNLTAKGSFILTLSNTYINDIQVSVNGLLRDIEYSNLNGYYTTNININDVVTILLRSNPTNYYKTINVLRRDYTTDEVAGNNGIMDTSISNNNSFSTTGLTVTFTATTLNYSYNFEYRISASIMSGTPTPTPTPSPTPTPPPFVVRSGANGTITDIIVDESDNLFLGGLFLFYDDVYSEPYTSAQYTKLYPNGGVYSGFSQPGNFYEPTYTEQINKLLFTNDDKVLVGGEFKWWTSPLFEPNPRYQTSDIIKMNKDSRTPYQAYPDATLTGATQNGFIGFGVNDVIQQSDNKYIIGGNFGSYSGVTSGDIVRINDNGTIDTSFNSGGAGFTTGEVKSIELQSDGKILVGGNFTSYNGFTIYGIIRLNSNGTRDTSFTSYFTNDIEFLNAIVNKIQIQADGKILVAGLFYTYNSVNVQSIIRLNTNGTIDNTFGSTSGFTGSYFLDGTYYGKVNDMILQSDGKILCAGEFTGYSGVSSNNIIRLNNDGTIDTSFNVGTGFNNIVRTIARQSTGNIMVGGDFTSYNGYGTFNRIARLSPDGGNNTLYVPLPTATPTPTPTITATPTITPTPTVTPTPTPTPLPLTGYTNGYYILVNDRSDSYPGTGTTWFSLATGTTYNGTLTNGPVWSGGTPGYFTFDGTNDWVDFGTASSGSTSGSFTFGGWVKTTTSATEKIFMMRGNDSSLNGWSLLLAKQTDNKLLAGCVTTTPGGTPTFVGAVSSTVMSNDTWYYIVGVWEAGVRIRIYVNGVLETTTATTRTNLRTSGIGWNLMRNNDGTYSNGSISEFIVYQSVLTGPQIGNNFNANASKYGY